MANDPIILAFDTSAAHVAVAVMRGDTVLASHAEPMARGQAEQLFPMIEQTLDAAGIALNAIDRIGVGIGPGNFTGIRISVAAARGLALSELSLELQPRGIVTLAAPFWGSEGWQNDGFALPVYAEQALATVRIRLFHGAEDTDVPPVHMQALSHALPRARHYLLPGQDHGFAGDLSPVTMAIAEL
jgi:tRNA threonylcarbamoyl adenosine modification protein YeaZ